MSKEGQQLKCEGGTYFNTEWERNKANKNHRWRVTAHLPNVNIMVQAKKRKKAIRRLEKSLEKNWCSQKCTKGCVFGNERD